MSSRRLVLFSGESEHFFFRRKCGSENKKKISKNSNGWSCGQNLVKSSSKHPPHQAYKDRTIKKKSICGHSMLRFDLGILKWLLVIFIKYDFSNDFRDKKNHDVIIRFQSSVLWMKAIYHWSKAKQTRLESDNCSSTYSVSKTVPNYRVGPKLPRWLYRISRRRDTIEPNGEMPT